jgi:hypothetical protein
VWVSDVFSQISGNGQSIVWGEGGSTSCNGTAGVSDVYVSSLWTLDVLFEYAWRNVKRATLSGAPTTLYAPFGISKVNPTYYGMLMMNRVLRGNGRVFKVALDNSWALNSSDVIKTWGIKKDDNTEITFIAIHKDPLQGSVSIDVNIPTLSGLSCAKPTGFVTRMSGVSLDSQTGINIAGQTFDNSRDGNPVGDFVEEIVNGNNNVYTINVNQYTAVALRVGCKAGIVDYVVPPVQSPPNKTSSTSTFFTPAIIAFIVIGGVFVLIVITCLIVRKHRKKTPQSIDPENHPHPFAKGNPFLYINGNSHGNSRR